MEIQGSYFLQSGATRNRDKFTSSCISLLFRNSLTANSSDCSTNDLRCFAQGAHEGFRIQR